MKKLIRFLPPILTDLYFFYIKKNFFSGNYTSWQSAAEKCIGYDSEIIFKKVKQATLLVKKGQAVYERDSVIFDSIQYSLPLLSSLLLAASKNNGHLSLVDFGGSLGSSYFQNKKFLNELNSVKWNIIEQKHFVEFGQNELQTNELKFYKQIEDCFQYEKPDLLLLSNALQYIENSYEVLEKLLQYNFYYIFFDMLTLSDKSDDQIVIQNVSKKIYNASYPCWIFSSNHFKQKMEQNYVLLEEYDTKIKVVLNREYLQYRSFLFKKKTI
ncbi:MAG: methyltransferase, TIGR04325 family [Bacteroidetes bacterium]|nr:methyltransferase, TIGR04325 family [Bacteroidota bacterium]